MRRATTTSEAKTPPKRDDSVYDYITFWISLADAVPDDEDWPPAPEAPAEILDLVWKRCRAWADDDFAYAKKTLLLDVEKNSPSYAGTENGKLRVYRLCVSVRSVLDAIVRQLEFAQSHPDEERDFAVELPPPTAGPVISLGHVYSGQERRRRRRLGLSVSEENEIDFGAYGEFLGALRKAEFFRIRRCGQCHRLFYATRRDKFECSLRCQNAVRQQRRRDRKAKEYEATRKRNKASGFKAKERISLNAALRQAEAAVKKNQREPHLPK